jgi:DNA uptake protein ComE-like DNA-binding protein
MMEVRTRSSRLGRMTLRSDHKALLFIAAVVVLGAGVRVLRAGGQREPAAQPALERQAQAAESAARATRASRGTKQRAQATRGGRTTSRGPADSAREAPVDRGSRSISGALDRRGYIGGRLDLDVATAAQIDSLPGISTAMAKRIVLDRMMRGPFVTRDGLRRVRGTGPVFMSRIDTLVTYSGSATHPNPADTAIPRTRKARARRP